MTRIREEEEVHDYIMMYVVCRQYCTYSVLDCVIISGAMPGLMYGGHTGAVSDVAACMNQMPVYQQQQFGR